MSPKGGVFVADSWWIVSKTLQYVVNKHTNLMDTVGALENLGSSGLCSKQAVSRAQGKTSIIESDRTVLGER